MAYNEIMNHPPLCSHCGKPVSGPFLKDYWGNSYHREHLRDTPQCRYCGRLMSKHLTGGGKSYSDGRLICGLCLKTAVDDPERAQLLLKQVHGILESKGIVINPFRPGFHFIDRSNIRTLEAKGEKQGWAVFERTTAGGRLQDFSLRIFLLKGLPESSFIAAAAHELMHIWFYSRSITDARPRLIEGSCNYASYLVLSTLNTPEAAYRIRELTEDTSPVYGQGFRKVRRLAEHRGTAGWLEYVGRHRRLPAF